MLETGQPDPLDPRIIEYAYRHGYFPMPDPESGEILWFDPDPRAVFPLGGVHVSRSLKRSFYRRGYFFSIDKAFREVVDCCAARKETWITDEFKKMYDKLFAASKAHSIEVWDQDRKLVGGLFGLHFGAVFHGESMFSIKTDASKLAVWLMSEVLASCNIAIFEVQFMTDHLKSLGAVGLAASDYHERLAKLQSRHSDIDPKSLDEVLMSLAR